MADEPKAGKEAAPKPVKKVKKTVTEPKEPVPTTASAPEPEAPAKAPPKPARKAARAPKAPPAKKPAPKPKAAKPSAKKPPKEKAPKKPEAEAKPKEARKAPKEKEEKAEAEHAARLKPELADAIRAALRLRRATGARRPAFYRQEWFRYKKLGRKWRKPQGGQSAMRRHFGYRPNVVSVGYRGPKAARGLHPSGFQEVLVRTPSELKGVDPKRQAVRIAGSVGDRKRVAIQKEADGMGLRVLNRRQD